MSVLLSVQALARAVTEIGYKQTQPLRKTSILVKTPPTLQHHQQQQMNEVEGIQKELKKDRRHRVFIRGDASVFCAFSSVCDMVIIFFFFGDGAA